MLPRSLSLLLLLGCTLPAADQDLPQFPGFPRPSYFRSVFGPLNTHVELQAPRRLQDHVVDNKIELNVRAYLEAVLQNSPDIDLQRLSIEVPRNAILRAHGIFDPLVASSFTSTRTSTPTDNTLAGAAILNQLVQPLTAQYSQLLPSGAQYNVTGGITKNSNNNAFASYNPAIASNVGVNFAQPLLRNRGGTYTKMPISIARSRLRVSEYQAQDQIIRLLALAENAYWDVVQARENLKVQEQALSLADTLLKRAQRELELGAISALDIYQPQQNYASQEIQVTQARYRLAITEDVLRRQMGADLDAELRKLPLVLTEPIDPPVTASVQFDREGTVDKALRLRPDLRAVRQSLDVDELNARFFKNQLLPNLSLTGRYGAFGRGGTFYQRATALDPITGLPGNGLTTVLPGGWGDSLGQLFGFGYPVYGFGLSLQLPIRDRANQANLADALVNKKQDMLRVRSTEQQTRQEVLNAISQVEQSVASVKLAQVQLDFAQKRVEAEQKKYDLGTTTIFFLVDAQNAFSRAQSDLVTQSVLYRRNLLNLLQRTGELPAERNLVIQ